MATNKTRASGEGNERSGRDRQRDREGKSEGGNRGNAGQSGRSNEQSQERSPAGRFEGKGRTGTPTTGTGARGTRMEEEE